MPPFWTLIPSLQQDKPESKWDTFLTLSAGWGDGGNNYEIDVGHVFLSQSKKIRIWTSFCPWFYDKLLIIWNDLHYTTDTELLKIPKMLLQVYSSFISLLIHARPLRSLTLMHRERTCSRSARIIWMGRKFYNIKFENSNGKKLHI